MQEVLKATVSVLNINLILSHLHWLCSIKILFNLNMICDRMPTRYFQSENGTVSSDHCKKDMWKTVKIKILGSFDDKLLEMSASFILPKNYTQASGGCTGVLAIVNIYIFISYFLFYANNLQNHQCLLQLGYKIRAQVWISQ